METVAGQQGQIHRIHLQLGAVHRPLSEEEGWLADLDSRILSLKSVNRGQEPGVVSHEPGAPGARSRSRSRSRSRNRSRGQEYSAPPALTEASIPLPVVTSEPSDLQHHELERLTARLDLLEARGCGVTRRSEDSWSILTELSFSDLSEWPHPQNGPSNPVLGTNQETQTPDPHPFAPAGPPSVGDPSCRAEVDRQVGCRPQPAQGQETTRPLDGAGPPYRAFPPIGVTMLIGLMIVTLLGLPAVLASTLVTPPTLMAKASVPPPVPTTGSGSQGLPVSEKYTLSGLSCPTSTARAYEMSNICRDSSGPSPSKPLSWGPHLR